MEDRSGEVEFLQQQVQRLNAVLSQYQKKYQPPCPKDEQAVPLSPRGPHANWLTDKTLLTPLLTEYDNVITQLHNNITTYQSELMSLNSQVEQVTAENARLYQHLREALESQVREDEEGGVDRREGVNASTTALQKQLAAISKERDDYRQKWRQTAFELEHLQKSDREKNRSLEQCKSELATARQKAISFQREVEELQTACVTLNEQYNQCVETAQAGEREVERLTRTLGDTRSEYRTLQIKNTELVKAHNELSQKLRRKDAEEQVLDGQGQRVDGRVQLLQLSNTELESKLVAALGEVSVLTKEKAELEESVALHRSRLAGLEREVHEAVAHVKESMEMVESAILDKDQAVLVSQQKMQEAERLTAAMDALLQEAGQRTRQEVDAVRAEYNKNIDIMAEEIQSLEEVCGKKQNLLERVRREKKSAEKELERVRDSASSEATRARESLEQLQNRVHEAERVKEEAHRQIDAALMAKQAAEACLAEEKRHCEEVCSELGRRVREREEEERRIMAERAQFAGQLQEMMDQLRAETRAREEAERRAKEELSTVTQHYELRERELQRRLQAREETHDKSVEELRELLSSQHRMGTRWREESKNLTQKFEETINSLRNEVTGYRRANEALKAEVETLTKLKDRQSQKLQRLQSSQSHLQQQLTDSNTRAEAQVSSLLLREKQLLAERRAVQRQLDKLKFEITRRAGIAMALPDPSVLSTPAPLLPTSMTIPPAPPNISTPTTPLDVCGWGQALSGLQHSIRQVRQELEETQAQVDHMPDAVKQPPTGCGTRDGGSSPDSSEMSQHTPLQRTDLSSRSSNTLPA